MIDVLIEDVIDLQTAAKFAVFKSSRTGQPAHLATMYRYVAVGARTAQGDRVRLEVVRTPGGLRTSREAVARFIAALTDPETACEPAGTRGLVNV